MANEEEKSKAQAEEKKQGDKKGEKTPVFSPIKTDTIQAYLRVGEKSVLIGECCIPRRYKQVIRLTLVLGKRSGRLLKYETGKELDDLLHLDRNRCKKRKPIPSLPKH